MKHNTIFSQKYFTSLLILIFLVLVYSSYFNGCTQSGGVTETMTAERQKAIEDSLLKVRIFEISKYWSTGYEYFKEKSYAEAKRYFLLILSLDPDMNFADELRYRDLHGRFLSRCYIEENKPDSTEWAFLEGIKHNPDNAYYYESLGYIYRGKNIFDKAITYYESAVELLPEKSSLYTTLTDLYYQSGDTDKAIEATNSYLKLEPDDSGAQEKLAAMYRSAGREEEATAQKEKMLLEKPDDTRLMFDLGRTYMTRDQDDVKALAMFKRLTEKQPENVEALQFMARAQMNLELYDDAINSLKQINFLRPTDIDIICSIAGAYQMKKSFITARTWVRKAITADSQSGLPYITLGNIYSAAIEHCASQKDGIGYDFDDKLIYQKAYFEYQKAKKDPSQIDAANRHMETLKPYLPTTEDKFMHPNQTQAKGDCYKWIY